MTTYMAIDDGPFAAAVDAIARMLSQCREVQVFLAVDGDGDPEAAALAGITKHAESLPEDQEAFTRLEVQNLRPRVFVCMSPEDGVTQNADGVGSYDSAGVAQIEISRNKTIPERTDDAAAITAMQRTVGRIMEELWQQAWLGESLAIDRIQGIGPFTDDEDEINSIGQRVYAGLQITWGPEE